MNDKQFGAFWDKDRNMAVYGELHHIMKDVPYRYYRDADGTEQPYTHFEPCVRPVPWPPEPVKKKFHAVITDQEAFDAWAELHLNTVPGVHWKKEE